MGTEKGFGSKCCTWILLDYPSYGSSARDADSQVPFENFLLDDRGLDRHCIGYPIGQRGLRGKGGRRCAPTDSVFARCMLYRGQAIFLVLEDYPAVSSQYESGFTSLEPWDQLSVKIIITK